MSSDKMSQNKLENSFTFGSRSARFNAHNDREGMAGRDAWSHWDSTLESDRYEKSRTQFLYVIIHSCLPAHEQCHPPFRVVCGRDSSPPHLSLLRTNSWSHP